jgi:MFS family permease
MRDGELSAPLLPRTSTTDPSTQSDQSTNNHDELEASDQNTNQTSTMTSDVLQQPGAGEKKRTSYRHLSVDDSNDDYSTEDPLDTSRGPNLVSIDQCLERLGMGKFQMIILVASGLCFAADAMQVILLSFLMIVLQEEWHLHDEAAASIESAVFAGALIGTLVLGTEADRVGRRPIFLLACFIIAFFGFCVALSPNYWTLVTMIFCVGFGVGGLTVPFDILAEFLPANSRGSNLLLIEYFWTGGCLYVVACADLTLKTDHWRWFVVLCTLPCCVALIIGYLYVPESARWLSSQGRREEALKVLRNAAVTNGLDFDEVFPPGVELIREEEHADATIADLFQPKWRNITIRLWGTWGCFAFCYYGTIMATTRVFESGSGNDDITDADDGTPPTFDYSAIFLSSAAEFVGLTVVIMLVDRIGRIPSQMMSYAAAGCCVCALCIMAGDNYPRVLLISLVFGSRVFAMAGTCVSWVMTAEVLTTEVRSTGHATSNAVARMTAFFCPYLVDDLPLFQVGLILLGVNILTVLFVCRIPETKGKSMGSSPPSSSAAAVVGEAGGERQEGGLVPTEEDHGDGEVDEPPRQII